MEVNVMNFFNRKPKSSLPVSDDPLVNRLTSNNEPVFLDALQEAVAKADNGDYGGITAIREAIRLRSGKQSVAFYEPGIRRSFGGEWLDRYSDAKKNILKLVKTRTLLADPEVSGDCIAAAMYSLDVSDLQNLLMEIYRIGGASAGYEFQLLYNELRSSARWQER
jgi:hypothetical protein